LSRIRQIAAAVTALTLAASGAAHAQLVKTPADVQAGTYAVESSHARVLFAVEHLGFSTWYGDFSHATGTLVLDPKDPSKSSVDVSVPTDSVSTTNGVLDGELKAPDWFDAARFPTISFKSTKVTVTSPGHANVEGALTLHGVTRPVTLAAAFKAAGPNGMTKAYTVGFDVSGKIRRSDFGVSKYVPMVGDEVTLIISAPFERKAG
jgi:polyisoprenoid-binding protein YceI